MNLTARDLMQRNVHVVGPDMTLPDLERKFLAEKVSGFPVVENAFLLGMVSHTDVVRQLCVERSLAEVVSDYYRDATGFHEIPLATFEEIADRVGERIEGLRVKDVMIRKLITVHPEQPLRVVAQELVDKRIHRVPVVQGGRLLGIVTTIDLVRLIADERVIPA